MPMPSVADTSVSAASTGTDANCVETAVLPEATGTTTADPKTADMTSTVTLHAHNTVLRFCPMAARWYAVLLHASGADATFRDGKAASGITTMDVGAIA